MSEPLYTKEQEDIRKALSECGGMLKEGKPPLPPDPHQLIRDRLRYHQKSIEELDALYNALPRVLPLAAANGLTQLLCDTRPRS